MEISSGYGYIPHLHDQPRNNKCNLSIYSEHYSITNIKSNKSQIHLLADILDRCPWRLNSILLGSCVCSKLAVLQNISPTGETSGRKKSPEELQRACSPLQFTTQALSSPWRLPSNNSFFNKAINVNKFCRKLRSLFDIYHSNALLNKCT
ncbi:hypothetical protein LOAG_04155 [Loa loa]|uniref:Uncharacterized protein n=1 Tax=Loa loa TaxID=7209 RepID=A0A1S0U2Q9_LOALO|nr:hypothetical protein LOAG_04155 [Loa loa]EFO24322.1 hypothetical protein LOAG_04155 [Loa loa]